MLSLQYKIKYNSVLQKSIFSVQIYEQHIGTVQLVLLATMMRNYSANSKPKTSHAFGELAEVGRRLMRTE